MVGHENGRERSLVGAEDAKDEPRSIRRDKDVVFFVSTNRDVDRVIGGIEIESQRAGP